MLANGEDSDQMLHFEASDLSLYGLFLSHRKDIGFIKAINPLL